VLTNATQYQLKPFATFYNANDIKVLDCQKIITSSNLEAHGYLTGEKGNPIINPPGKFLAHCATG
jgi:hypothetical protein